MTDKWLIWCDLNDEQHALAKAFGDRCVSIEGSTPDDERVKLETAWREGDVPILISKPSLFGHGLNWQHCQHVVFVGVSHSFEQFFQAVRRCWRFGVAGAVDVHIISSELEGKVVDNLKSKAAGAEELSRETRHYVADHVREAVNANSRDTLAYSPTVKVRWPAWLRSEVA